MRRHTDDVVRAALKRDVDHAHGAVAAAELMLVTLQDSLQDAPDAHHRPGQDGDLRQAPPHLHSPRTASGLVMAHNQGPSSETKAMP